METRVNRHNCKVGRSFPVPAQKASPADSVSDFSMSIPASWPVSWWQQGLETQNRAKTSIVSSCVDAYAQTIATIPPYHWRLDDEDTKERIRTSAASRTINYPNSYQTRSDFYLNLIGQLLYHGNAYALGLRNDRNELVEMHLLDARTTAPYIEPDSRAVFYGIGDNPLIDGEYEPQMLAPSRDIMHIRLYTPRHPLVGVSPIENAANSIASNASITRQQATFFDNMNRPSGILSTDAKLTKDQMLQLREAFNEQSKNMNTGGVPILGQGLKWSPMSITSQDAQLVEAFHMTVEDIARAFRVPLPLVNDNRHSTYNNVEQLISHWLSGGLGFLIDHVENNLDRFFGLRTTDRIEFDVDMLLRTDFMTRVEGYTKAIQHALMSPNEARAKFSGLSKVAHGDKPIVQQQMVPLGWTENQPQSAPEPEPAPVVEPELDEDEARGAAVYYLKKAMNDG
jgi:HK97 family phage portal protein